MKIGMKFNQFKLIVISQYLLQMIAFLHVHFTSILSYEMFLVQL